MNRVAHRAPRLNAGSLHRPLSHGSLLGLVAGGSLLLIQPAWTLAGTAAKATTPAAETTANAAVSAKSTPNGTAPVANAAVMTPKPAVDTLPLPSADAASYDIGLLLGSQLRNNGVESALSLRALDRGLKESLQGKTPTSEERDDAMRFMRVAHQKLTDQNSAAAKEFLAHNAKQPGVVSLPSGLQYRVLGTGDAAGTPPGPTDQVTVRYRATLADGTEFDRSEAHDRPATFRVNSTFKAWQEAFQAMKPGATWQLFVPPELGYGSNTPPGVPPGSLLIYELELLKVEAAPPVDPNMLRRVPSTAPGDAPPAAQVRKPGSKP